MRILIVPRAILIALMGFIGGSAHGSFHVMQIEQIIGNVNGDTSAQAIQLRMRSAGQNLVSGARLIVRDSAGQNPILVKDMTSNVANFAAGDRVLIVSSNFPNYTTPSPASDFFMTQTIPTSYFTAGRLTYEDDFGTIYWSLSWGGAGYTGSNTGSAVNDLDGNFGPAFVAPLPSTNTSALLFSGAATAPSTSNLADYSTTGGTVTFVNNAHQQFAVYRQRISSITRETDNIRVTWTTFAGKTNFLQRASGSLFANFSNILVITNKIGAPTNYLDAGAATNFPAAYYRIGILP